MKSRIQEVEYDASQPEWDRVAATPEFKRLITAKKTFILPATLLFLAYYFLLLILAGYAPKLLAVKVFSVVNVACMLGLSVILTGWIVVVLYAKFARKCDDVAKGILERPGNSDAGPK